MTAPRTYLTTPFRDKERVKALGARWDAQMRSWYVPGGQDLTPFLTWLPAEASALATAEPSQSDAVATAAVSAVSAPSGIGLQQLLEGVGAAVAAAIPQPVWVRAEVVKASISPGAGHVYLELSERSPDGRVLAQARATIWRTTADTVLAAFQKATGMVLGPGLKLLMLARPSLHPVYGLSLVVEDLDASYSLGDLEARRREIRLRLQQQGLFNQNQQLPAAWMIQRVLVVAPAAAAGLGDFRAEADRLERHGLCTFSYVHSRFQGEGAAAEVAGALQAGLDDFIKSQGGGLPDVVVIIRGGGAVNDLAWLEDEVLVRAVCLCPVPVLTGIGHERDRCLLDEAAHQAFDTPSKVIEGIRLRIVERVRESEAAFQQVISQARSQLQALKDQSAAALRLLEVKAREQVRQSQSSLPEHYRAIELRSRQALQAARAAAEANRQAVERISRQQIQAGRAESESRRQAILLQADAQIRGATERCDALRRQVIDAAGVQIRQARERSDGLLREIIGQGPQKTLQRGFAMIRLADQTPLTSAEQAAGQPPQACVLLEFHDGLAHAQLTLPPSSQEPYHEPP